MAWSGAAKIASDAGLAPPAGWRRNAEAALEGTVGQERDEALRYLANAVAGLSLDPTTVLARITDPSYFRTASADVADIEADRGDLTSALGHQLEDDLDLWLEWLLTWSIEALREAATIAAWSSPQWQTICDTAWPPST
jgi:hypothetical protein